MFGSCTRTITCLLGAVLLVSTARAGDVSPAELTKMRDFARQLVVTERYEDAIAAYITIAEETPEDPRSHYDVAGIMVFLRMYAEALPRIDRAIALDPENALYHELAALSHMQLQQPEQAFISTRRGAELGDIKAMYTLSGMYEKGHGTSTDPGKALYWLEQAASAGHMGAMDAMARVYRDGLYGQAPDATRQKQWEQVLERELAK